MIILSAGPILDIDMPTSLPSDEDDMTEKGAGDIEIGSAGNQDYIRIETVCHRRGERYEWKQTLPTAIHPRILIGRDIADTDMARYDVERF